MEAKMYRKLGIPRSKIKSKFLKNMNIKVKIKAQGEKTDIQLPELNKKVVI